MVDELLRMAVDHGGAWGVVALIVILAGRSRPGRELSRVATKELRWRYLRAKGYSKKQLRKMLLDDWGDDDKPPDGKKPPDRALDPPP